MPPRACGQLRTSSVRARRSSDLPFVAGHTMTRTFADLGVSKPVVAALAERDVIDAFPIQEAVIEAALAGRDLCGKAPTEDPAP